MNFLLFHPSYQWMQWYHMFGFGESERVNTYTWPKLYRLLKDNAQSPKSCTLSTKWVQRNANDATRPLMLWA